MSTMFPNMEMQFLIWASFPPHLTVHPSGLDLTFVLETQAFAVLPNASLAPLFLIEMVSGSWAREQVGSPGRGLGALPSESGDPCDSYPVSNLACGSPGPEMGASVLLRLVSTGVHSSHYSFCSCLETCVLFPVHSFISLAIPLCICGCAH